MVANGNVLAAAQEERFTRIKHDPSFPIQAIEYCLDEAGVCLEDLSQSYAKPYLKFDRLFETYLGLPLRVTILCQRHAELAERKITFIEGDQEEFTGEWNNRIVFVSHHESHTAKPFF